MGISHLSAYDPIKSSKFSDHSIESSVHKQWERRMLVSIVSKLSFLRPTFPVTRPVSQRKGCSHSLWKVSTDRNCIDYLVYGKMLTFLNKEKKSAHEQAEKHVLIIGNHTNNSPSQFLSRETLIHSEFPYDSMKMSLGRTFDENLAMFLFASDTVLVLMFHRVWPVI